MNIPQNTAEKNEIVLELKNDLANLLDVPVNRIPTDVNPEIAGEFLNTSPKTLAIWRTTGRYNLRYFKISRLVRYRTKTLIDFKARKILEGTDEIAVV
jgi:hypothetical protein